MIPGLSPQDIGLPPKFTSWRKGQLLALDRGLTSEKRFMAHSMPTGEGKSAFAIASALLTAKRACYLTSSKGLQAQLSKDFGTIGLCDIRGRNNYHCINKEANSCEDGQYYRCPPTDCPYEQTRLKALNSSLVCTNYSYFMLSYKYGRGLGEYDLLIVDEAHASPDEVCSAMTVEVTYGEATKIGHKLPREDDGIESWWQWAKEVALIVISKLEELRAEADNDRQERGKVHPHTVKETHFWTRTGNKCQSILESQGDYEWVVERTREGYKLEPVWAFNYAHKILFMEIPRVILLSATMVRKTLELLGIDKDSSAFYEYPSSFPVRRSPVYIWGASKVDHKTDQAHMDVWYSRIDNFIKKRLDRKGIIHSVSYQRARDIRERSEYRNLMIVPATGKDTQSALLQFKRAEPPCILVSPAITTGYDFPGSQCEYNMIVKVPFLDTRDKIIKARSDSDPEYAAYITAQTITQSHGRAMRSEDDSCETVVIDSHMNWFVRKYRSLFPSWFLSLVSYPSRMPEPPAALPRTVEPIDPELAPLDEPAQPISNVIEFPTTNTSKSA